MPATKAPPDKLNGISSAAVEKATGKTWTQWLRVLDKAGAGSMPHKEIALYLAERHGVGDWWSQMVTVGYEQARGLRQKHQKPDGFEVSSSKTVNAPVADLFAAFQDPRRRVKWLSGATLEIRKATPAKSLRITWDPAGAASTISADFYVKGPGKSSVSLSHGKLASAAEARRMKAFWAARLAALKAVLES
jgi:uncharacterized protein YndB with AHSA1/START domain